MSKQPKFKRLFWDIEVSPNLVFSWNVGYKLSISHDNIVQERAIICIGFKWEGEKKVSCLQWDKGNDKKLLQEFVKVLNQADEIVAQNGDQFDMKWLRARCLYHGIPMRHDYSSVDTLKLFRKGFRLNSNKLDYVSRYLGLGQKKETGFSLWRDIVLKNSKTAMDKMKSYCKHDVVLLEKVFNKLKSYVPHNTHVGVLLGKSAHSCPECGATNCISNGVRITAAGLKKQRMHCANGCGRYFSITIKKGDI